ncbi:MAG: DUF5668 domain-containing protein [Bacteroidales bacterium]|nr:DUF5668 domain-containing protein [Bacteroidales bacterium]
MSYKNAFWGVLLLTVGVLFALRNFDIISFNWRTVVDLWPLLLVLWGVSMLPFKPGIKLLVSAAIGITAVVLVIALPKPAYDFGWGNWHNDIYIDDDSSDSRYVPRDQDLSEEFDPAVKMVILDIDAAAGTFNLKDTTADLVKFESHGNVGSYHMTSYDNQEGRRIKISMEDVRIKSGRVKNEAFLKLNPSPEYEMNISAGASKLDFDLSAFKIRRLDVEGGASKFDLRIGDLVDTLNINLEMGVSSIDIYIPKSVGCQLKSESVLSSRHLPELNRISEGLYQTSDFSGTTKKVFIKIESAVSSFSIKRY